MNFQPNWNLPENEIESLNQKVTIVWTDIEFSIIIKNSAKHTSGACQSENKLNTTIQTNNDHLQYNQEQM